MFKTFFFLPLSDAAVVRLNFSEELPGRSPQFSRKDMKDFSLVSEAVKMAEKEVYLFV